MKVKTISVGDFGPKNEKEAMIFAEEKLRINTQYLIQVEAIKLGLSEEDLKIKLGISKGTVKRIFEYGNITIRELARIFYILGKECRIVIDDKTAKDQ